MKKFFKTILYGIYGISASAFSILNFAYAVVCLTNIADNKGFIAVLFFVLGIICLALGVLVLWLIGYTLQDIYTSNDESNQKRKEE